MGVKRSEYVKQSTNIESYHNYIQGTGDLLGLDEENKDGMSGSGTTSAIDELLGTNPVSQKKNDNGSLLDLDIGGSGSQI